MKKYKVLIDYPGSNFRKNDIINADSNNYSINTKHIVKMDNYPGIFEPIKEPLFTTFDEVEIFEEDGYYLVETDISIEFKIAKLSKEQYPVDYINYCFSSKESAEKWISENKPIFSKKQIMDAIKINQKNDGNGLYIDIDIRKDLGL